MHLLYLGGALGGATVGLYQNGGCNESLTRYPLSLKMASFLRESTPYTIVSSAQQCAGLFYYRKGDETDDEQETVPPDVAKVDFILTLLDKIIGENGHLQPEDRSLIGQSLKRIYVWKLNVHKYALDSTNHEVALSGAKFVLYRKNSVSQEEYATINNNNKITGWVTDKGRATTLETSGAGDILIEGLNVGTYYLEETEAPAGYNKLTEPIEVKITATPDATGVSETVEYRNQNDSTYTPATNAIVKVLNKAGTQLPSTGGIGTTLFYVIGGGLMAVAAVLLVTKKRMNNK